MPLQGDLKEFGVPEMLQLLEQQGKSGCLQIRSDNQEIEVYFQQGKILGVFEAGKTPVEQMLQTLGDLGFLSEQERENTRKQLEVDLRSLPEVLRQQGVLEIREFEMLLQERIEELLFSVFPQHKGTFSFVQDKRIPSEWGLKDSLPVEPLILEGLRRTDEWPMLKKRVGSFRRVPRRKLMAEPHAHESWKDRVKNLFRKQAGQGGAPPDKDEEDLAETGPQEWLPLTSSEKHLYALVDGRRNLGEVLTGSTLGQYVASRAFLSLLEKGWVQLPSHESPPDKEAVFGARKGRLGRIWLLLGGLTILLWWGQPMRDQDRRLWIQGPVPEVLPQAARLLNNRQREQVQKGIEIYQKENGRLPSKVSDLLDENILRPHHLSLWGPNRFSYQVDPAGGYRLLIVPGQE